MNSMPGCLSAGALANLLARAPAALALLAGASVLALR